MRRIPVHSISEVGAARWFEVGRTGASPDAIGRLKVLLSGGDLNPHLRLVAMERGRVMAKLSARIADEHLRFSHPIVCPNVSPSKFAELSQALLDDLVRRAHEAPGVPQCLRTEPADDVVGVNIWLEVLRGAGFVEIACNHIYVWSAAGAVTTPIRRPRIKVRSLRSPNSHDLAKVFTIAIRETQDRRDKGMPHDAAEHFKALAALGGGFDPSLWRLASTVAGRPCGYAIGAARLDGGDGEPSGWILDIGVLPEKRCVGIGTALLCSLLKALQARGESVVKASIDDANRASRGLHAKLGFTALPGRFMTYARSASGNFSCSLDS